MRFTIRSLIICAAIIGCENANKSLDKDEVSAFGARYSIQVQALNGCFAGMQKKSTRTETEITYEATIAEDGSPVSIGILNSNYRAQKELYDCIVKEMMGWSFPVHAPPRRYKVIQSLKFKPSEQSI